MNIQYYLNNVKPTVVFKQPLKEAFPKSRILKLPSPALLSCPATGAVFRKQNTKKRPGAYSLQAVLFLRYFLKLEALRALFSFVDAQLAAAVFRAVQRGDRVLGVGVFHFHKTETA